MANTKNYFVDPNATLPSNATGKTLLTMDPANAIWNGSSSLLAAINYHLGVEKVDTTATTLAVDVYRTRLVVSGAMTCTLPNGLVEGQKKLVICESAASTPAMVMTITTADTTTGYVTAAGVQFDTAGQAVEYMWTTPPGGSAAWRAVRVWRAGSCAVTVGTTVLTNNVLSQIYALSVTGTVSSTTTKGIPNGQVAGEVIHIVTPTAASIPVGNISITGTTVATGVAATSFAGINATTCEGTFVWDPTNSWQNVKLTTATFS
jgi:hypothetical protein